MKELFQAIIRHSGLIVFVALEIVCMVLVVQFNETQSRIWKGSASHFSGLLYQQTTRLADFLRLQSLSDSLAAENARLYEQLAYTKLITNQSALAELDTSDLQYRFVSAQVINNSVNRVHNTITINKGRRDGVRQNMGVMTTKGVVGIVTNTSKNMATVMSLLNRQASISSSIKRSGVIGNIVWKNPNSQYADLTDVPKHREVMQGDTIETSGFSTLFPPGMYIGKVDTFWLRSGDNFYTVKVELGVDFDQLDYVMVVQNDLQTEQIELEGANE